MCALVNFIIAIIFWSAFAVMFSVVFMRTHIVRRMG